MRRLILRPGAIGDCLLALPAMQHLRAEYTEVWVPSPVVPLIQFANAGKPLSSTGIDTVGIGDLAMSAEFRGRIRSFDSVVSWYGSNRPEFRRALTETGVPCEFHRALPPDGFPGHATDFFASQVGAPSGLTPRIEVTPSPPRHSAVIHPFSGSARKNWPLANFVALAKELPLAVEWTAGPEEVLPHATRFADLAELASWLRGTRVYIGNDSGITHLAAATGVPAVALFGPTDPRCWAPRGENVLVVRNEPLEDLSVETVLAAVNRLLGSP